MAKMGTRMRMAGAARAMLLAAGLALAGAVVPAQAAAPVANAAAPMPAVAEATPGIAPSTAAPGNAQTPAAAPDPLLAEDGAPKMAPTAGVGMPVDGVMHIQPQVTANGEWARWFHNWVLFPVIAAISVFVLILLFIVIFRFNARANPVPSKTSHNTLLEVLWTLGPVVALAFIAAPSIGLLSAQYKPAPAGAVTLKAIGNQWYWSYQYPDNGGFEITANMLREKGDPGLAAGSRARTDADGPRLLATDNRVVLPVGVPIRLITTSNDVIHSWAMPAFWIKLDAIPGRLNETSFTIEKPGVYFGQCSELCGARHAFMPIAVEAVPPATFAAWVRAKGGTMPGAAKPSDAAPAQLGADVTENGVAAANTTGPVENATVAAPASSQGATGNPGGVGDSGR